MQFAFQMTKSKHHVDFALCFRLVPAMLIQLTTNSRMNEKGKMSIGTTVLQGFTEIDEQVFNDEETKTARECARLTFCSQQV
jgi:hypothetical protein